MYKKEKKGDVTVFYVKKMITDEKMTKLENTHVKPDQIHLIIEDDADVYDEDTKELLLKFRKNKLSTDKIKEFYDATIKFAQNFTSNRGTGSGSKIKTNRDNIKIKTNIIGFFDRLSPSQKYNLKSNNKKFALNVRETRFNADYPEKFKKTIPLIQEIDHYYEKLVPDKYKLQRKKANQTFFRIPGTSFTTVTLNVNFKTTIHKDKGDDPEGFGNLSVIENTPDGYTGGETCFPQYGVGVNVRNKDVLFMNVHKYHGNLPIHYKTKDAQRFSIVCYLREHIWKNTRNISKTEAMKHIQTLNKYAKTKNINMKTRKNKTRKNKK